MGHSYVPRNPRGQQRDKIYREALRLELADMSEGVDLKKLRQIARVHIEKAASGDMLAIKELGIGLEHANLVVLLFHAIHTLVDHFPEFVPKYLIC